MTNPPPNSNTNTTISSLTKYFTKFSNKLSRNYKFIGAVLKILEIRIRKYSQIQI